MPYLITICIASLQRFNSLFFFLIINVTTLICIHKVTMCTMTTSTSITSKIWGKFEEHLSHKMWSSGRVMKACTLDCCAVQTPWVKSCTQTHNHNNLLLKRSLITDGYILLFQTIWYDASRIKLDFLYDNWLHTITVQLSLIPWLRSAQYTTVG